MDAEHIYRRAGGRRRYNAERQRQLAWRRVQLLLSMRGPYGYFFPPSQIARWAEEHGVSTHTIYRDLRALNVWATRALRVQMYLTVEEQMKGY